MGITSDWLADIFDSLRKLEISCKAASDDTFNLVILDDGRLVLNLIPMVNSYKPELLVEKQKSFHEHGILLIQLWEDIWLKKKEQVLSRIISLLGRNQKLHGRKTKIEILDQARADEFLFKYHLQGSAKARYKFGLTYNQELVAVATFSGSRLMKQKGPEYRSAELIRFASKSTFTVTGGLTKLLKHYLGLVKPNDLMSYADRDWSYGKGYESSGFILTEVQEPSYLWLDTATLSRYFPHRRPTEEQQSNFVEIFNTGNLKYILYL
ncbi:MAG: hypothetical protein JWQ28_2504 [Pedobacter sp.]|nr:hypothetical protein [Pedobacter sp.]